MFGLSHSEIVLLGFLFTVFIVIISTVASYVGTRVGTGKDIASHETRLNKHSERMDKVEDNIGNCMTKGNCQEWRGELGKDISRIENTVGNSTKELKTAFGKLDDKFDTYILNQKKPNKRKDD